MALGPTTRTSAVDACEAALRTAILEGRFAPGDRLPPERTLAETLGVNRTTLRSALSRLGEAGLVSPRQGDGCIVLDYRREGGPELVASLLAHVGEGRGTSDIARDLFALRRAVAEVVLGRIAEARPRGKKLAPVRFAVGEFEQAVRQGASAVELAALDVRVLAALVDLAESDVFRLFLNPMTRVLAGFSRLTERLYAHPAQHVAAHAAVLAWLDSPSPEGARALLAAMALHDASVTEALLPSLAPRARKRAPSKKP
jgi:GntR family transcriptional repressor for pyruvate dehydrogenase complex